MYNDFNLDLEFDSITTKMYEKLVEDKALFENNYYKKYPKPINCDQSRVVNAGEPVENSDLTTKLYVDNCIGGTEEEIQRLDEKIDTVNTNLTKKINDVDTELTQEINDVQNELDDTNEYIANLETDLKAKDNQLQNSINTINSYIPNGTDSGTNQLANNDFVNSSIQTATAYFDGNWDTFAEVPTDGQGFEAKGFPVPSRNNYLIIVSDETHNDETWRYKYNTDVDEEHPYDKNNWKAEYKINNSAFTDKQLKAINSGITSDIVDGLGELSKKDTIDNSILIDSNIIQTSHIKDNNVTKSKLSSTVQESLNKADTALQEEEDPVFKEWKNERRITIGLDSSVGNKRDPIAIGNQSHATMDASIAIGGKRWSNSVGANATADGAIALGAGAQASATDAVQIGYSETSNNQQKSLRFRDTTIVNSDGKIPSENLDIEVPSVNDITLKDAWDIVGERHDYSIVAVTYNLDGGFWIVVTEKNSGQTGHMVYGDGTETRLEVQDIDIVVEKNCYQLGDQYKKKLQPVVEIPVTSVNTKTGDVVLTAEDINYNDTTTVKAKLSSLDSRITAESSTRASADKLKLNSNVLDLAYDKTKTYDIGKTCTYEGNWYKCKTAITTPHAWDANEWEEMLTISEIIDKKLNSDSTGISDFSELVNYSVNNPVIYDGKVWICKKKHNAAPWNETDFALSHVLVNKASQPSNNIAIGNSTISNSNDSVAIGSAYCGGNGNVAIGFNARVETYGSVQLGNGTNTTAKSLQFRGFGLAVETTVDGVTKCKIPNERLNIDDTLEISGAPADAKVTGDALVLKSDKSEVSPLLFTYYYPDGSVKSATEFTPGIKYDDPDITNRTITIKPFCNTGTATNDNSNLSGRVVIPPFVDVSHNGYISDDGTRYKVVGVGSGTDSNNVNENLTSVIAPNTVTNIGDKAFRRCTKLKSASIPAAMSIGGGAFNTCSSLVSVSLPAATSIGTYAFNSCTKLASVSLLAATSIGENAFNGCTKLASISLPVATNIRNYGFINCSSLASVSLPEATSIGNYAFALCTKLASVSLPAATSIGNSAFATCTSLTSVNFGDTKRSSVPTLGTTAFNGVSTTCKIIVPDSQYEAWTAASGWSALVTAGYQFLRHSEWEYVRRYEINPLLFAQYYPEGNVKSAAEFTPGIKYNAPDTTNRTITVKPFCNTGTATNDNSNLSGRVVIPPFVDAQGNGYISDDGTRYKVVGVSGDIKEDVNTKLTALIAPNTVTTIGYDAFRNCTSLKSVSLPAATSIGYDAFDSCTSLTSVSFPSATSIGYDAFNGCSSLVSVSLPAAASIVSWTFVNCTSLKSISLSAATSIGDNAFRNCTSLKSVSLPAATSIKGNAFNSCYLLVSVSLPVAVNIKGSAFNGCYSLASVSLPAATSIEDYAFVGCTSLESIDFGATLSSVPTLGSNVFNNVPTTCKIIVPDSQYDAWTAASGWSSLVTRGYKFLKHSEWEYARKYEVDKKVVKTPVYNGQNHEFLDANDTESTIYGFTTAGVHHWTASYGCIVYLRALNSADTKPVLYVHVNNENAGTTDYQSMLFKQTLAKDDGIVVPIFLNAGDTLDIRLTSNLSQLNYSVFYTN